METMTWQERQAADRAAREAAEKQSKADLRDLAHQLGAAKPGTNGDNAWYVTMQHEGQELTVCLSVPWYVNQPKQARRVKIEPAVWRDVPHYRPEDYAYYPSGTTPSERGHISVSLDQSAERIAREIKRRCLPFAAAEMETIKRNVERRRQRDSARATLAAAFIAASGGEPIPPERLAGRDTVGFWGTGNLGLSAEIVGDSLKITCHLDLAGAPGCIDGRGFKDGHAVTKAVAEIIAALAPGLQKSEAGNAA